MFQRLAPALGLAAVICLTTLPANAGTPAALPPPTASIGCQVQGAEPDPTCTPGAVLATATVAQICVSGYSKSVREVTVDEKRQVYAETD